MSKKEKTVWKIVLCLASDVGEITLSSPTVSGAIKMHPVMGLKNAPFGRPAAGVLVPSMLTTSVRPPITLVPLIVALSILDILTLAAIVRQLQPDYSIMS